MTFRTPDYDKSTKKFRELLECIAQLRNPDGGCPWDVKQTIQTLRPYMIEEAYEACEAMATGDKNLITEELGDVLLQVVLNAQVGVEKHGFDIYDVIEAIRSKIVERHPHVFSDRKDIDTEEKVLENWQKLKAAKKGPQEDPFKEARNMGKNYPALTQAEKIGKISKKVKFDWPSTAEVFKQVESEFNEVKAEVTAPKINHQAATEEIGDLMFSIVQLCRHMGIDPEVCAFDANQKFLRRFDKMMDLAQKRNVDFDSASLDEKEKLWIDVKKS